MEQTLVTVAAVNAKQLVAVIALGATASVGWIFKKLMALSKDHEALKVDVAKNYVGKADLLIMKEEIKSDINDIRKDVRSDMANIHGDVKELGRELRDILKK